MQTILKRIKVSDYLRRPLCKWIIAAIVFLIAIYGIVGFFVIPGIIGDKAQQFVSEKFQRKLEFKTLSLNPFTLTATIDGMRLTEPKSEDNFVSFDHLTVDLSIQSLFRMAPVVEEIKLVNPRANLVRTDRNHYNFDDFIAFANEPKEDDSPARFSINNIQIENAVIKFDDLPQKKHHVIDELNVSIPFISSIPSQVDVFVDLAINGRFNQEKIEMTGKARPFFKDKDGTVHIKLDRINLPTYIDYLPFRPNFVLKDGRVSIDMEVGFGQNQNETLGLALKGNILLESFLLTETNGHPIIKIPKLDIDIAHSDVLSGKVHLGHILLKDPEVFLERDKAGQWNVERIAKVDLGTHSEKSASASDKKDEKKDSLSFLVNLDKFAIDNGQLQINDQIHVVPADFSVKNWSLDVDGIALDVSGQMVSVDKVVSAGTAVQFVHGKLKPKKDDGTLQKTVRKTANDAGEKTGFGFQIGRFELNDWSIYFENRDAKKPVITKVDGLTIALDNLSSHSEQPVSFSLNANVNQKGSMTVAGTMTLSPFKTQLDLDFKDVDVRFIQPYINDFVNLSVQQADLTIKGKAQLSEGKHQGVQGQFVGDVGITRFATVDQVSQQPFVSWKTLALKGIHADLAPLSVVVDQIRLDDLVARVILSSKGRLNLQDILVSEAGGRKSLTENEEKNAAENTNSAASLSPAAKNETKKKEPPNYAIKIKEWRIGNGQIRFSDNFIRPRYTADLLNLQGTVSGLTTDSKKQATVNVKGRVNGAPLMIAGSINPLSEQLSLDIKASVKGMELAQFSSYSGKYIGYGIDKGKLSFDVAYKIKDDQLSAENALILDQLTLGEKVESESAINLPVHLALSLLKDRNGVIDINLPIGGSLSDPEFSVGGIIFKVFVNLIQKAVTAPFSLLASIVSDSEQELSWLAFEPGSDVISDAGVKKLESLAKALESRPGLSLEIAGRADPESDAMGLGKQEIMRKIKAMKAKEQGQDATDQSVTISDKEYPDWLKRLYSRESFSKPKNWMGLSKSVPVQDMETLLSRHFAGKKDDLIQLANKRALAVKDWLVEKGKIPEKRLFLLAASLQKTEGDKSGNRVDFSLK